MAPPPRRGDTGPRVQPILLVLGLALVQTAVGFGIARAPRSLRTVLLVLFAIAGPFTACAVLPEELVLRGILAIAVIFNGAGNVIAIAWRILHPETEASLASYLWDVQTVGSNRTVPELAIRGVSVPLRALRGLLCVGATVLAVFLLRRLPDDTFPLLGWIYLKLHVVGLGAQGLSDLEWALLRGRCVPLMRWPLLSTSFLDFWGRRYNLWIHGVLFFVARDLLRLGRRPKRLLVAAFLVSGALHEVLCWLVLGRVTGWWMAFWVAQVALTFVSVALGRALRGTRAGPLVGLLFVHVGMTVSAPLFFAVFDRAANLFGPVTPAPWSVPGVPG